MFIFPLVAVVSSQESQSRTVHIPVMGEEVITWLDPREGGVFVDGTVGAGGHASLLARRLGSTGRLLGLDRDPEMLKLAAAATEGLPVKLVHAAYDELGGTLRSEGLIEIDGILLDLGLSSDQLRWPERGFSFTVDGPLDMRYDPTADVTAEEIVNEYGAGELADIIYQYGEERFSRRIARRIVEERQRGRIKTTGRLAEIVRRCIPGRRGQIDPATRVFQALRIAVNDELLRLENFLKEVAGWLKPGGRVAIISFHSLEDRLVKRAFRGDSGLNVLTRKPLRASELETKENPRARSAKMRVAQRWMNPALKDESL